MKTKLLTTAACIGLIVGGELAAQTLIVGGTAPSEEAFVGQVVDGVMQELFFGDSKNRVNGMAYSKECNVAVVAGDAVDVYDFKASEGTRANAYITARLWDVAAGTVNGKPVFVAVGDKSNIISSPDCGKTWKQAFPYSEEYKKGGKENVQKFRDAQEAVKAEVLGTDFAAGFTHYRGVEFVSDGKGGGKFIATGSFDNVTTFKLDGDGYARFASFQKHTSNNMDQAKDIVATGDGKYMVVGKLSYSCDASNKCKKLRGLKKYDMECGIQSGDTTVLGGNFSQVIINQAGGKKWSVAKMDGRPNVIWNIAKCNGQMYGAVHTINNLISSSDGAAWKSVQLKHHADNEEQYRMKINGVACMDGGS